MQAGSDQFILKDFAFYDSMATAVVGVGTIAVYEVLRRNVWRKGNTGGRQLRIAIKTGVLASCVTLAKLSLYTGISVRQIHRHLNHLRDLGWVKDVTEASDGRAIVFEMGETGPDGAERYLADEDVANLWEYISQDAEAQGWDRPLDILCAERFAIASKWFDRPSRRPAVLPALPDSPKSPATVADPPCQNGRGPLPVSPPEYIDPNIHNSIERSEEYTSRAYARDVRESSCSTGVEHRPDRSDQDAGVEQDLEEESGEIAIDAHLEANDTGPTTLARRLAAADREAESAVEKNRTQKIENERRLRTKEAKAKNFSGRPVEQSLHKDLQKLWSVWYDVITETNAPPASWLAKDGDVAGRQQATKLLKMYGCDRTVQAVSYVVRNWEVIGKRFFKQVPGVPSLGMVLRFHEVLFREAPRWGQHQEVLEEWEKWWKDNPAAAYAPDDLQARHDTASSELSALGLGT